MARFIVVAAAFLLAVGTLPQAAAAQTQKPSALPGGASSLQETYQDWRVACAIVSKARTCTMSQQQARKNGKRVLAVELRSAAGNALDGTLVLPFGLQLDTGVVLQIDDRPARDPLRFRTCMPVGCLVPLKFGARTVKALRSGTALKLKTSAVNGKAVTLTISLKGFAAARDRLTALTAE